MRAEGKNDDEIIKFLVLKNKVPFKMNREYLENLFGFVTSRKATEWKTQKSLEYGYEIIKQKHKEIQPIKSLNEFFNIHNIHTIKTIRRRF